MSWLTSHNGQYAPRGHKILKPAVIGLLSYIFGGLAGSAFGGGGGGNPFGGLMGKGGEAMGTGAAPGEAVGSFTTGGSGSSFTPASGGWQDYLQYAKNLPSGGQSEDPYQQNVQKYLDEEQERQRLIEAMKQSFYGGG